MFIQTLKLVPSRTQINLIILVNLIMMISIQYSQAQTVNSESCEFNDNYSVYMKDSGTTHRGTLSGKAQLNYNAKLAVEEITKKGYSLVPLYPETKTQGKSYSEMKILCKSIGKEAGQFLFYCDTQVQLGSMELSKQLIGKKLKFVPKLTISQPGGVAENDPESIWGYVFAAMLTQLPPAMNYN